MKIILFLLTTIITNTALACSSPIRGEKYDSQIEIQKLENKNQYKVSVPRFMENMSSEAKIILAYSKGYPGGIPIYEKYEVLKPTTQDKNLVAEFVVKKNEKKPYIVVMWWPRIGGLCGIQANTGYLDAE